MELITFILITTGLFLIFVYSIKFFYILFTKPYIREWSDHLRYNKRKIIITVICVVLGTIFISPLYFCNHYGKDTEQITSYKLVEVDNSYIANTNKTGAQVYIDGLAENTTDTIFVRQPIYIISDNIEPRYDNIKITHKWLIFEISEYENRLYLNNY